MKYYIDNTFVDPTHCCFRYTKIVATHQTKTKLLIMNEKQDI